MFGSEHKVGKLIYRYVQQEMESLKKYKEGSLIEDNYSSSKYYKYIIPKDSKFYRGRKSEGKDFSKNDLWAPPRSLVKQGRFNMLGDSVFYLTDNQSVIPYEVDLEKNESIFIAEFSTKIELNILDLDLFKGINSIIGKGKDASNKLVKEYLLSNYISKCAEEVGFDGVSFKSVESDSAKNYIIFIDIIRDGKRMCSYKDIFSVKNIYDINYKIKYEEAGRVLKYDSQIDGLVSEIKKTDLINEFQYRYKHLYKDFEEKDELMESLEWLLYQALTFGK